MKNLQRLHGIDGDYDNDSGSGPDRIAKRKTIQVLEKSRQPRRQIGTLDVAFKKRFLKLSADENMPGINIIQLKFKSFSKAVNLIIVMFYKLLGTPILTRQMSMKRETIKALEVRKNSVMAEKRKSAMQTLGAKNEYGISTLNSVILFYILHY